MRTAVIHAPKPPRIARLERYAEWGIVAWITAMICCIVLMYPMAQYEAELRYWRNRPQQEQETIRNLVEILENRECYIVMLQPRLRSMHFTQHLATDNAGGWLTEEQQEACRNWPSSDTITVGPTLPLGP